MGDQKSNKGNSDRVSEEELGDDILDSLNEIDLLHDLGLDSLFDTACPANMISNDFYGIQLPSELPFASIESSELNPSTGPADCQVSDVEQDRSHALIDHSGMRTIVVPEKRRRPHGGRVHLSSSVDVSRLELATKLSRQLFVVYELEEVYRPRYRTDYFADNGKIRPPRYVTDRMNRHFVTLRGPAGISGVIRIDWLTVPNEHGEVCSMPYKFQDSNERIDIPTCNPIYKNVTFDQSGTTRLYLVLIKSKQDELKFLQPLQPFQPYRDAFGHLSKQYVQPSTPVGPKQLIQMYQLTKSQLAFTFCSVNTDGTLHAPEWDTTALSTVLTETQSDSSKRQAIVCPRCKHTFHAPTTTESNDENDDADTGVQFTGSSKRKAR